MSSMLDNALDEPTAPALTQHLAARVAAAELELGTAKAERDALADDVRRFLVDNETALATAGLYLPFAKVRLNAATILGLEGMAQAAQQDLEQQGRML